MDGPRTRTETGHNLHNDYVLTSSPAFGNLLKFFRAAVRELIHSYIDYPRPHMETTGAFLVCDQMRWDIDDSPQGSSRTSPVNQIVDVPVVGSLSPLILSSATPPLPVVDKPVRSLTPNSRSLSFLQTGPGEHAHITQGSSFQRLYCKYRSTLLRGAIATGPVYSTRHTDRPRLAGHCKERTVRRRSSRHCSG